MKVFHSIDEIPAGYGPSVVTIGNFDGVHRGHVAVIKEVIERARALHAHSVAVTFDPHPARVLRPQVPLKLITRPEQKLSLLADTGIDAALVLPFTHALSRLTAREFARTILVQALDSIEVQEGENFRFGADAGGDVNDLVSLGKEMGFEARVHRPTMWRGKAVSSSKARETIELGDVRGARQLLGRPFAMIGRPTAGRGYGKRYVVPTINFAPYPELVPAAGVYVTCLEVGGEKFQAVTNVGVRPTFGAESFAIESHILDFHPIDLEEDTEIRLSFLDRIRDEKKWPTPEALKEQIGRDVERARRYFQLCNALKTKQLRAVS